MLAGVCALVRGLRREHSAIHLPWSDPQKPFALMGAFRVAIIGLCVAVLGLSWAAEQLWLAIIALIVLGEETFESTMALARDALHEDPSLLIRRSHHEKRLARALRTLRTVTNTYDAIVAGAGPAGVYRRAAARPIRRARAAARQGGVPARQALRRRHHVSRRHGHRRRSLARHRARDLRRPHQRQPQASLRPPHRPPPHAHDAAPPPRRVPCRAGRRSGRGLPRWRSGDQLRAGRRRRDSACRA